MGEERQGLLFSQTFSFSRSFTHNMRTLCGRGATDKYPTLSLCFLSHFIFMSLSFAFTALFGILDNYVHLLITTLGSDQFSITLEKGGYGKQATLLYYTKTLIRRTALCILGSPLPAPRSPFSVPRCPRPSQQRRIGKRWRLP